MRRLMLLALLVALPLSATAQQPSPIVRPPQVQVPLARLSYAESCVRPGQKIVFEGSGLPPQRGARRLAAQTNAGAVDLAVASWSATRIAVTIPADPRLAAAASVPVGIMEADGTWGIRSERPLALCAAAPVAPEVIVSRPPGVVAPPLATPRPAQPQPAPGQPAPKPPEPKPAGEPTPKPLEEPAPAAPPRPAGPPPEAPCPDRLPPPPAFVVTCPLVMLGAGTETPAAGPFTPVRLRTDALVMWSVGMTVTRPPFRPLHLRTEPLTMTGVGAP